MQSSTVTVIRNHLRDSDAELRQYLAMKSERLRFRARTVEDIGDNFAKLNFRLLAQSSWPKALGLKLVS